MSNGEDPCQGIVDAIANLQQEILDLKEQEQDAIGPARTIIQMRLANVNQRIREEEQALQRCRKNPPPPPPPPFVVTFTGNATVTTDNNKARGPFDGPFNVFLTFSKDHRVFVLSGFNSTLQGISISQTSGGRGDFDPSTGSTQLELGVNVKLPIPGDSDAALNFFSPNQLTTERAQGSRLNRATGELTLAGASTLSDNVFVNGTHVQVLLAGTFTPLP
jgi:hypothetical protein